MRILTKELIQSLFLVYSKHENTFISLKSDSHHPKKFVFICFNKSPLKVMKNAFYFILEALFVIQIFKFLSKGFGHIEKTA